VNTATSGVARAAGIVLVLVLAAAAGLAVGNLIQQVTDNGSIAASPRRSLEGLAALQPIRDEESDTQAYADYGIRHAPAAQVFQDYGVRHPIAAAPALVWQDYGIRHPAAAATTAPTASTSDTFRLTGPSDVDEEAPTSDTFRLTGPSGADEPDFLRSRAN